jgi:hypothetical protein
MFVSDRWVSDTVAKADGLPLRSQLTLWITQRGICSSGVAIAAVISIEETAWLALQPRHWAALIPIHQLRDFLQDCG